MSITTGQAFDIANAGMTIIGVIVKAIERALRGDADALAKLKRVDAILSEDSPTEAAFAKATTIAAGKPSRETP